MLMPLSKSFQSLKKRLQCIAIAPFEVEFCEETNTKKFFGELPNLTGEMSIQNCLNIFDGQQAKMDAFMIQYKIDQENRLKDEQNGVFHGFGYYAAQQ